MADFNLGTVTAYGYARDKGYTGTEAEFAELMASYAQVAEDAAESAEQAAQSASTAATKASEASASATDAVNANTAAQAAKTGAETAAQTATTKADEASGSATTASTKATEAATSATSAAQSATTATTKAGEAATSATNAAASATSAAGSAQTAQDVADSIPADYTQMSDDVDTLKTDVSTLKEDLSEIAYFKKSNNLLNPNGDFVTGLIQENGTVASNGSYANYSTSDYIKLDPTATYQVLLIFTETNENVGNRRALLLFDADKQPISGSYKNGYVPYTITGAHFVRVSCETAYLSPSNTTQIVIQVGNSPQPYEPYEEKATVYNKMLLDLEQTTGASTEKAMSQNAVSEVVEFNIRYIATAVNLNYADVCDLHDGYMGVDGIVSPSAKTYQYTDKIQVASGETIYTGKARMITFFNGVNPMTSSGINYPDGAITSHTFTVPDEATAMVVSLYASDTAKYIKKVDNTNLFTEKAEQEIKRFAKENKDSLFTGKKWWACGDSFTEWTTEQYSTAEYPNIDGLQHYKTYPFWIGKRTGMTVYNFAVSGQTMAMPANPGTFTNAFSNGKYMTIPSDVDYITLKFGINDSHHATGSSGGDGEDNTGVIPIGDVTDTGTATFCGAYNTVLAYLIENHPFAKIGILVSNGCDTDEYRQKTIAIAKKWGIAYLDENGDERCPVLIRSTNPEISSTVKDLRRRSFAADYPDNTHPNVKAHEYESTIVEAFLRSL